MKGHRLAPVLAGLFFFATHRVDAAPVVFHVPRDFPTIQSAVRAVPKYSSRRYKIAIAPGIYQENVSIGKARINVTLTADGTADATQVVISTGRGAGPLSINADGVRVSNITLLNTAGFPEGNDEPLEGRALYTSGDRVSFRNVRFIGVQDTIFFETSSLGRSYFYNCYIAGSADFICGGGTAFFDSCIICNIAKPGYVTAPATPANLSYGFVFWNTRIFRDANVPDDSSYLMRPWGADGATAFINTAMDRHIIKAGWAPWVGHEETCRAYELNSVYLDGTPVDMRYRASWVNKVSEPESYFRQSAVLGGWEP
jgi:pectinesterase